MKNMKSVITKSKVQPTGWYKVTLHFKDIAYCNRYSFAVAQLIRRDYPGVYFARYTNALSAHTDYYINTTSVVPEAVDHITLRLKLRVMSYCQRVRGTYKQTTGTLMPMPRVSKVSICSGSHPHALGFDVVLACLDAQVPNQATQFLDVIHWMNNMFGYDYVDEARNGLNSVAVILGIFENSIKEGTKILGKTKNDGNARN